LLFLNRLSLQIIVRSGAVLSCIGTALLITFIVILIAFPILKECQNLDEKCEFISTAPEPLKSLINPIFLSASLLIIASGVAIIRFGTWYQYKKTKDNISEI
jgi:hypothetical protein